MVKVTAAIIEREGQVLLAQRREDLIRGLEWELPGGKMKEGETPEACLTRELKEELSVNTRVIGFFASNTHRYPEETVKVLAYKVDLEDEDFKLTAHEQVAWVSLDKIGEYNLVEADKPIINKLKIHVL